jgi:peptidoglycan/xylan/chitin deacetylase (PgdA/CDA1 family)
MWKGLAKAALFRAGPAAAYHRARNRRVLTVVMFHRVLERGDRRWGYCDPEYTIAGDLFAQCLDFFRAHYHVVSIDDVLAPDGHLPDHPLLITFDDGWADHEQVALPVLANLRMPALVFVAADAVDAREPTPFWENRIIHAYRRGALDRGILDGLWYASIETAASSRGGPEVSRRSADGVRGGDPPDWKNLDQIRALIARLVALDPERIPALIGPLEDRLATPADRHMMNAAELANLPRHRVAIGGHGARHRPLARVRDAGDDLARSQRALADRLGAPVPTMSFPHGSYDQGVVDAARAAGFRTLFTSDPVLNELRPGEPPPPVLGRIGFDPVVITDARGRFRPELLALWLWRRPHARLTGERAAKPT